MRRCGFGGRAADGTGHAAVAADAADAAGAANAADAADAAATTARAAAADAYAEPSYANVGNADAGRGIWHCGHQLDDQSGCNWRCRADLRCREVVERREGVWLHRSRRGRRERL